MNFRPDHFDTTHVNSVHLCQELGDVRTLGVHVHRIQRLARRHEQSIALGAAEGEVAADFRKANPAEKLPGDAMLAALQTPAGQLSAPIKAPQGYYVVKVLERVPPDIGGLAAERDKIQKEVLVQKQSLAWESWINGARANSKIETHLPASRRG